MLLECMYVYHVHAIPTETIRFPGARVINDCKPPNGNSELSPGPLEDQPGLLTAKPSLQLQVFYS